MRTSAAVLLLTALAACQPGNREPITDARSANGLAYDLVGEGSPIVLLHGTNIDRRLWDDEISWLREGARVLRYDLRGHGQSPVPEAPYSNHGDLIELLDELEIASASLIGLSAGAQIALDVVLAAPDRVERLVLVSPSLAGYVTNVLPPFFSDLRTALQARDYEQANEVLLASPLMSVPEGQADRVRSMVEASVRMWTIPPSLLRAASPPAIRRLEEVQAPALILVGEEDLEAIREQAQLLAAQLPNARLVTVPGGGHLLNLTSPEAFRDAVSAFLESPAE